MKRKKNIVCADPIMFGFQRIRKVKVRKPFICCSCDGSVSQGEISFVSEGRCNNDHKFHYDRYCQSCGNYLIEMLELTHRDYYIGPCEVVSSMVEAMQASVEQKRHDILLEQRRTVL